MNLRPLLLLILLLSGCASAQPFLPDRAKAELRLQAESGIHIVQAALAQSDQEKAQGLMGVRSMAEGEGMLFPYGEPFIPAFWMKGMEISLDFAFIDGDGRIVHLLEDVPPCRAQNDSDCPRYSPPQPAQHVLELRAGSVRRMGLAPGNLVLGLPVEPK